ncbi:BMP family ABC transporter substrate-binding protein [Borreliella garinii]|uniref:BMP family ABC transporter substrate-binding protein n=2 Tax=Borreliella garinii TaxID=29519 RepID=UPI000427929A|nr:BMP family ABC transporter substrate-binding protein [Borreliella garinii]
MTSCFSRDEIESGPDKIKISVLVDGVLDDKSFNFSANRALLRLEEDFPENIEKVFLALPLGFILVMFQILII